MLRLENLNKTFGEGTPNENRVLRDINFKAEKGDFITVIGSNGAGKTSLFNQISGHHSPTGGRIIIDGTDVTAHKECRRAGYIGRIFQDPLLGTAGNMSIADNMLIAGKKGFRGLRISLNAAKRDDFRARLAALDMDLENRLDDNVGLLSGGQRQALALLMMSLSRPKLVLLDEHTAALDPRNARKVMDLTVRLIGEYGFTVMMITHNMQQAIDYGNRLIMMDEGSIIADISGEEKSGLTVDRIVEKFHSLRNKSFANDRSLLS